MPEQRGPSAKASQHVPAHVTLKPFVSCPMQGKLESCFLHLLLQRHLPHQTIAQCPQDNMACVMHGITYSCATDQHQELQLPL